MSHVTVGVSRRKLGRVSGSIDESCDCGRVQETNRVGSVAVLMSHVTVGVSRRQTGSGRTHNPVT